MSTTPNRPLVHNLGYPRIGPQRELKRATEAFWSGNTAAAELHAVARSLRAARWRQQAAAGVDLIPSNDWSLYDHVLDTVCLVGALPPRFGWNGEQVDLDTYFHLARGVSGAAHAAAVLPLDMTKWFDTNYHYLVPELEPGMRFSLASGKPFDELAEAAALGIRTVPVLLGPVSFLHLAKIPAGVPEFDRLDVLHNLLAVYAEALRRLSDGGAHWVQLDEPVLALDLDSAWQAALRTAYAALSTSAPGLKLLVATYFGELRDNLETALGLPVHALHIDAVRGAAELDAVVAAVPPGKLLSVGIVDGRNVWKNDLDRALQLLGPVVERLGSERVLVAPSCSLLHVPVSLSGETQLDGEVASWLAFADEKLRETRALADALGGARDEAIFADNRHALTARRTSARVHRSEIGARISAVRSADFNRPAPFLERQALQRERLKLPLVPTTTIGSFPQTGDVRRKRAQWKRRAITTAEYETFLQDQIDSLLEVQENLGLDLLVHGEFERNDMVEYFGEQLEGFAQTDNGWVQSYGTRYVKPPIVFGDVVRPHPMTVRWSSYAQSRAARPVKGMLTGPVTIAKWSFVRDDQPMRDTVMQIAIAIRDEVADLEHADIAAIQIDEPALREGLPLRSADRPAYLRWAVGAFRLAAAGASAATQIHTHMCYADFNDILDAVTALDADVISIEAARSGMELLRALVAFRYPNGIGPGIYDIHSPRVPSHEEMAQLLRRAADVLPLANLWANPDCGLKTRSWNEVLPALRNMVTAAQHVRAELEPREGA